MYELTGGAEEKSNPSLNRMVGVATVDVSLSSCPFPSLLQGPSLLGSVVPGSVSVSEVLETHPQNPATKECIHNSKVTYTRKQYPAEVWHLGWLWRWSFTELVPPFHL